MMMVIKQFVKQISAVKRSLKAKAMEKGMSAGKLNVQPAIGRDLHQAITRFSYLCRG